MVSSGIYFKAITHLYYLIVQADHVIDPREEKLGQQMQQVEGIDMDAFSAAVETLRALHEDQIYKKSLELLRQCTEEQQIRIIAWVSLIANADGFMAPEEFQLIHKIYHRELQIDLQAILLQQKKIRADLEAQGLSRIV